MDIAQIWFHGSSKNRMGFFVHVHNCVPFRDQNTLQKKSLCEKVLDSFTSSWAPMEASWITTSLLCFDPGLKLCSFFLRELWYSLVHGARAAGYGISEKTVTGRTHDYTIVRNESVFYLLQKHQRFLVRFHHVRMPLCEDTVTCRYDETSRVQTIIRCLKLE